MFGPVGLLASVRVAHDLMDSVGLSIQEAVGRIALIPMDLQHEMWTGIVWNSISKPMIASGENQSAARKLMFFAAGGDLTYLKTTPSDLKTEIAGLLNRGEKDISLEGFSFVS